MKNLNKYSDPLLTIFPALGYMLEIKATKKSLIQRIINGSLDPSLYGKSRKFDTILYEAEREITMNVFTKLIKVKLYSDLKQFCIDCSKIGPNFQTIFINFPQDPKDMDHVYMQILLIQHTSNTKPILLITELSPSSFTGRMSCYLQEFLYSMTMLSNLLFYCNWDDLIGTPLISFGNKGEASKAEMTPSMASSSPNAKFSKGSGIPKFGSFLRKAKSYYEPNVHKNNLKSSKQKVSSGNPQVRNTISMSYSNPEDQSPKIFLLNSILNLLRGIPRVSSVYFNFESHPYYKLLLQTYL